VPELVGEPVDLDRAPRLEQEQREHRLLPRPAERERAPVTNRLDRTKDAKLGCADARQSAISIARIQACCKRCV
jgi:hypothetical protein